MNNIPISNHTDWAPVEGQNRERIELVVRPTKKQPNKIDFIVRLVAQSTIEQSVSNFLSKIDLFGWFKGIEFKHKIGIKKIIQMNSNLSQDMINLVNQQTTQLQQAFKKKKPGDQYTQIEAENEYKQISDEVSKQITELANKMKLEQVTSSPPSAPPSQSAQLTDSKVEVVSKESPKAAPQPPSYVITKITKFKIKKQPTETHAPPKEEKPAAIKPAEPAVTPKELSAEEKKAIEERDKMHAQYKMEDAPEEPTVEEPEEEMQIVPFVGEREPATATGVEDITEAYDALEKQLRTMSANIKGELKEKVGKALAEPKSLAVLKELVQELETENKLSTPTPPAAPSPTIVQPPAEPQLQEKDRQLELREQLKAQVGDGVKLLQTEKEQLQPLEEKFGVSFNSIRSALVKRQAALNLLGSEDSSYWGMSVSRVMEMSSKQLQAHQTKVKGEIEKEKKLLDSDPYKIKQAKQELKNWADLKKNIEEKAAATVNKKVPQVGPYNALKKAVNVYDQEIKKAAEASQTARNLQGFVGSVHDRYDKIQKGLAKIEKHEEQLSFSDQLTAEPENSKKIKADFLARVKDEIDTVEQEIENTWEALYGVRLGKERRFSFKGALVEQELKKTRERLDGVRGDKTALNREQLIAYENQVTKALEEARNNLQSLLKYSRKLADADDAAQEKMKAVNARITELEQGPEPDLAEQLKKLRDPLIAEYGKLPRTLLSFIGVEQCTKTLGDITGKLEAGLVLEKTERL